MGICRILLQGVNVYNGIVSDSYVERSSSRPISQMPRIIGDLFAQTFRSRDTGEEPLIQTSSIGVLSRTLKPGACSINFLLVS